MSRYLRPRIGPAFLVALVLAGLLLWWRYAGPRRPGPVIVEHQTAARTGLVGIPSPDFVLQQAERLNLSAEQRRRLDSHAREWEEQTGDLRGRLDQATRRLRQRLQEVGERPALPSDFENESQAVQELSRQLAALRAEYWERIKPVLSTEQQSRARQAWDEAHRLRASNAASNQ